MSTGFPAATSEEIQHLLSNRPAKTQTFQVAPDVFSRVPIDAAGLRSMDDTETLELAEYLGAAVADLDGPLRVVDASCPHCARRITVLDFVKTAVHTGQHERGQLRDILTGRAGAWVTIRGRDGGRPVHCANCGEVARRSDGYSEYSSEHSYKYA